MKTIKETHIEKFRQYLILEEKGALTIEKYIRDVNNFKKYLGKDKLTKEMLLQYKQDLLLRYKITSANSMLISLNLFFKFYDLHSFQMKLFKSQKNQIYTRSKELSLDEYKRLLSASVNKGNWKLNLLLQTICSTGIRVSEL